MMAFESWDRELNALLNEAVTPKFQVRYLPNNRDTYKIEKGFASKKEAQDWIKGENLRDRAEDISIETSTSKEVNEGKIKDIDIDMTHMTDTKFKEKYGKSKADMKKDLSGSTDKKPVKEGMTVSVSKGQQGSPDSVTISAQDSEADQLLSLIKQAGLGLFGGEDTARTSAYGAPVQSDAGSQSVYPDSNVDTGDHDGMMALMQKVAGNDYEDEESQDASCDVCGSGDCGCNDSDSKALVVGEEQGYDDKEDESLGMRTGKESGKEQSMKDRRDDSYGKFGKRTDEDETEDQMEFEVSEANAPDSGEAETTADENAEAKEDQALAGAMSDNEEEIDESEEELTEWANDAGYQGSENIKDNTFEQDIEFMTRVISGGLNGQKQDQTTLPHTKVKVAESSLLDDWKKLSGIR
jgi:pterin-4a-carbinolamine dehydratase